VKKWGNSAAVRFRLGDGATPLFLDEAVDVREEAAGS